MLVEIIKYLSIYLLTMVKFIAGPTMGPASGLSWGETVLITIAGMMTSVLIFTSKGFKNRLPSLFGKKRKKFLKKKQEVCGHLEKIWFVRCFIFNTDHFLHP